MLSVAILIVFTAIVCHILATLIALAIVTVLASLDRDTAELAPAPARYARNVRRRLDF